MPDRLCGFCDHAALDGSGVWCKLFGESIFDERVAQQCGAYANEELDLILLPKIIESPAVYMSPEGERTMSILVEIDYFGKEELGEKVLAGVVLRLGHTFKDRVRVNKI